VVVIQIRRGCDTSCHRSNWSFTLFHLHIVIQKQRNKLKRYRHSTFLNSETHVMATNAHNQPQPSNVEPVKEEYIYIYANALERVDGGKRAYT